MATQHHVFVTQHHQFSVLGHIAPRERRDSAEQRASEPVGHRDRHPAILPTAPTTTPPDSPAATPIVFAGWFTGR
jgi:hypothetical protein